ncbi:MAG: carbohydrate kinase family protein [Acidobacteriaceae bacterium]|nr:carbohydrate kinase family protein [Acidobacteriaceae bacterium]
MPSRIKAWDVVVAGDYFLDIVMSGFGHFPRLGEEAFAQRLHQDIGGGAAITSCGLAKLGVNVAVLGVVGAADGMWLVKRLIAAGVHASALEHHPNEPSGVTVSVSTPQDRAFYTYYGANEHLQNLLKEPEALQSMLLARHVHFACGPDPETDVELFRSLTRAGVRVSIDVGWHEPWLADPRSLDLLREADLFFPNEREGERLTGQSEPREMLNWLWDQGVERVALKLGSQGAMAMWHGRIHYCPPYPVKPVDTTGAGDSFDAGFIYGWLQGLVPEECLRVAAICGALSTRGLGGLMTFPDKEELEEVLAEVMK